MIILGVLSTTLAIEAFAFLYLRLRRWKRLVVSRTALHFPKLCPACIFSEPSTEVFEASSTRKISFRRNEFLHVKVPYCLSCGETITRRRQISRWTGFILASICFAILYSYAYVDTNDNQEMIAVFIGLIFAFGWPVHELWGNQKRGVVLKGYNNDALAVKVKNNVYFEALKQVNS